MTILIGLKTVLFCIYFVQVLRAADVFKMVNLTELINKYGYPVEVHEIETEDGYLLDLFRIPYGRKSITTEPNRFPVIINHGLMGSSENFIIGGPNKALIYVLADHGYDVWLCNARGSWHSRKHKFLDPDQDTKFWKFSWHEIGYYDLPATIDYVLRTTNTSKVSFIGHSQGTTTFFVMASERPEYNDKINIMIGMAPSALLSHIREPALRMLAPMHRYFQSLAELLGLYELIPHSLLSQEAMRYVGKSFCGEKSNTRQLCTHLLVALGGFSPEQIDPATIPLIASTGPAGCSVYQVLHYAQLVTSGRFKQYDWGSSKRNMKRYNSLYPPEYNLQNITCPVSFMYGVADTMVTMEDAEILGQTLPNVVDMHKMPLEQWTHMDFIWAKNIDKYVNKYILRVLRKYNG